MNQEGPGWTWTDRDGPRTDLDEPRQIWGSHRFQMVLPDFGTNDCGIRIGGLESEDIRTFFTVGWNDFFLFDHLMENA